MPILIPNIFRGEDPSRNRSRERVRETLKKKTVKEVIEVIKVI